MRMAFVLHIFFTNSSSTHFFSASWTPSSNIWWEELWNILFTFQNHSDFTLLFLKSQAYHCVKKFETLQHGPSPSGEYDSHLPWDSLPSKEGSEKVQSSQGLSLLSLLTRISNILHSERAGHRTQPFLLPLEAIKNNPEHLLSSSNHARINWQVLPSISSYEKYKIRLPGDAPALAILPLQVCWLWQQIG